MINRALALAAFAAFFFLGTAVAQDTEFRVVRVIDGDTLEITGPALPGGLKNLRLRVLGVDTPEKGSLAHCEQEKALAAKAKAFTQETVTKAKAVRVKLDRWDKYGGRVLGDVLIDGQSLSHLLVAQGYAVPYFGRGPKKDWCTRTL